MAEADDSKEPFQMIANLDLQTLHNIVLDPMTAPTDPIFAQTAVNLADLYSDQDRAVLHTSR